MLLGAGLSVGATGLALGSGALVIAGAVLVAAGWRRRRARCIVDRQDRVGSHVRDTHQEQEIAMVTRTFTVSGMHCEGCESSIEAGLRRLDGIRDVTADHQTQTIRVRFDERRLGADRLAEQLERIGYTPLEGPADDAAARRFAYPTQR